MDNVLKIIFVVPILFLFACNKKERNSSMKNLYMQKIESREWKASCIIGEDISVNEIKFIKDSLPKSTIYGLVANFKNNIFSSENVSKCGNDYFTHVYGKYKFYEKDKIMISLDSIAFSGEWKKPTIYKNGTEIDFQISEDNNSIIFTKTE